MTLLYRPSRESCPYRVHNVRRGNILVLTSLFMTGLTALLALSIDLGYIYTTQSQLDRSVDAAALAGASQLSEGHEATLETIVEYLVRNPIGPSASITDENALETQKLEFLAQHSDDLEVQTGHWNALTHSFEAGESPHSAVLVSMTYPRQPMFFGRVFGRSQFQVHRSAVAMYQPRDIMLTLDLSGSMNDDSEYGAIQQLGEDAVNLNLEQIWHEMGAPVYGNMGFEPTWVTIPFLTLPAAVTWKGTQVVVNSSVPIESARIYKSNGGYREYNSVGTSGTLQYEHRLIHRCELSIDGQVETVNFFDNAHIRRGLGLDGINYPSEGSWNDVIDACRSHHAGLPWYDDQVGASGNLRKFGVKSAINFWLKNKPRASQSPFLAQVSAQPLTAVKDAVDVFLDDVGQVNTADRVGVSVYNSENGFGRIECALTEDLQSVHEVTRTRQAGHYQGWTNIADGLKKARQELEQHGRNGASKIIVLMTDGVANWTGGTESGHGPEQARQEVVNEAQQCRDLRFPIVTISLGSKADLDLMEEVADISGGIHYSIPGGVPVETYADDLIETFEEIATARPLKLVQ
ncbi:MAG: hypothetical protein CMJ75_17985 [Planctomycetaceae bacterium]|nr:hypothetical protein [Planctomycetaceae bacterium]